MTSTPKTRIKAYKPKTILILAGVLLFFVWPIIIAPSSGHLFFCNLMSPTPCADTGNLSDTLALVPTIIGSFLLALGLVYDAKLDRHYKILIILAITAALSYVAYWLIWVWFWVIGAIL